MHICIRYNVAVNKSETQCAEAKQLSHVNWKMLQSSKWLFSLSALSFVRLICDLKVQMFINNTDSIYKKMVFTILLSHYIFIWAFTAILLSSLFFWGNLISNGWTWKFSARNTGFSAEKDAIKEISSKIT